MAPIGINLFCREPEPSWASNATAGVHTWSAPSHINIICRPQSWWIMSSQLVTLGDMQKKRRFFKGTTLFHCHSHQHCWPVFLWRGPPNPQHKILHLQWANRTFKPHTMPFKHHLLRTAHLSFFNEWAPQVQNPISLKVGIAKCGLMKMAECPPGVFARATSQSRSPSLLSSPTASGAMSIASVAEPRSTVQFLGNAPAKRQSISPIKAHDNSSKNNKHDFKKNLVGQIWKWNYKQIDTIKYLCSVHSFQFQKDSKVLMNVSRCKALQA